MKKLVLLVAILTTFLLSGCATFVNGTTSKLNVNANVNTAKVYINGAYRGEAPLFLEIPRDQSSYTITIEAPGYDTYTTTITRHVSGWAWGNIVFGGPIGLLVDVVSGGLYTYNTDTVYGTLNKVQVGQLKK